ncbi:hypothetical protein O3S81_26235 [Agrobacterium sp. SOY23]|nr:inositol monophosphatase family protein [Agrobacterium sp. SOY23]MCZ4433209.1 hypothetical protein [Agrobacterium sp. SOY23]
MSQPISSRRRLNPIFLRDWQSRKCSPAIDAPPICTVPSRAAWSLRDAGPLTPWDHLAGTLIATEAGARITCLDGSSYSTSKRSGALLTATDPDSWRGSRKRGLLRMMAGVPRRCLLLSA